MSKQIKQLPGIAVGKLSALLIEDEVVVVVMPDDACLDNIRVKLLRQSDVVFDKKGRASIDLPIAYLPSKLLHVS